MTSSSPTPGHPVYPSRSGAPRVQNAGQYPAAPAPVTSGRAIDASIRSAPPGGGAKSERRVSMRPELHAPSLRVGTISRAPLPSRRTLAVESVMVSTSPVPHCGAGQPG